MGDLPEDSSDRDEALLRAARSAPDGDLRAFEVLVGLYRGRILADCKYLTRDDHNAEDLAQEVFVKAYFALSSFEGRSTFRHWLQRIKVNHCLNYIKKRDGKTSLSLEEEGMEGAEQLRVSPDVEKGLAAMEEEARIGAILRTMPATLRIPLIMSDMDEIPNDEIAKALGIGLSAVKMRIKRGREHFRRLYDGAGKQVGAHASR